MSDSGRTLAKLGTRPPQSASRAFALAELIAILSVLMLLGILVLPAIGGTKADPRSFQCLNNLKQLATAWRVYAEDHSDRVIYNMGVNGVQNEVNRRTYRNWANDLLDWSSSSANTNLSLLENGILSSYLGRNGRVYRCPSDSFLSPPQRVAGWSSRTRSYSMNAFFGPYDLSATGTWVSGKNTFYPAWRQWLQCSEVVRPAENWVFVEEHPDSINDGYFVNNPSPVGSWGDVPGSFHSGACGLAFADGHVELHRWRSSRTMTPVRYNYMTYVLDPPGRADFQWLASRSAVPY